MTQDKCDKCEETGLLYDSGELPAVEKKAFEKELSACPPCDKGYRRYAREKSTYFTEPILSEDPSSAVDSKIKQAAAVKPVYTSPFLFGLFVKKSVFASLFLVVGLGLGFYVVYQSIGHSENVTTAVKAPIKAELGQAAVQDAPAKTVAAKEDSIKADSSKIPFSKRVGNTNMQGVVPVDLNK